MTLQSSWQASDALRSVCDKGHNWISNRASKIKTLKSGYNKIRPKLFPKGLTTFKKEHCDKFDEDDEPDRFLKYRTRFHSVDVIDSKLRAEFRDLYGEVDDERVANSLSAVSMNDVDDDTIKHQKKETATNSQWSMELKPVTPSRYKRRNSKVNEKIFIKSSDDETVKILPSVLLTYNEKFINIRDKPDEVKSEERVYVFGVRSDSMKSIDI